MASNVMDQIVCPKGMGLRDLLKQPEGKVERVQYVLRHRNAKKRFETCRRVPIHSIGEDFPKLGNQRITLQADFVNTSTFCNVTIHELAVLTAVCASQKPRAIFEFGTYDGFTTLHLAMNSPQDTKVTTIDLPPDDRSVSLQGEDTVYPIDFQVGRHYLQSEYKDRITQLFCDTTKFDHSAYRRSIDFIFIDAGHEYHLVKSDTLKAMEMIAPGGVIFWHDYTYMHFGVYTWLNEFAQNHVLFNAFGTTLAYYVHSS